ncbi:MAG: multicopper oxidase domain-containing protein [Microthrixaceae bacterium]|nr:multicopper oxidase domain-containing protein [Microthrixaceae bacterium]
MSVDQTPTQDVSGSTKGESPYSGMLVVLAGGIAMALIVLSIGLIGRSSGGDGDSGKAAGGGATNVAVDLSEFKISGDLNVASGGTLDITNKGSQIHNLVIDGGGKTSDLNGGESESLAVDVAPGTHVVYCSISGHREAGMEAELTVTEGSGGSGEGASTSGSASTSHSTDEMTIDDYVKMDQQMLDSFNPFVEVVKTGKANTKGIGGKDLEPNIVTEDGVVWKEWTLTAEIVDWEISPGKTVKAWTYNGTVPGPILRGEVGDHIRVKLINKLPMGTDIHMHGMILPNDMDGVAPLTQDLVPAGGTFTYQYEVTEPAIAMYHPHHHGQMTVVNGMWGAMIFSPKGGGGMSDYTIPRGKTVSGVTIPADLKVAQEHNMVLNDAGVIGLSLNGKSFPATEPYSLKTGDWMLVNYYNEGLQYHPMHLHQFPQLVIARDGIPLDYPYFADTISVGPGERYTVLFQATKPGIWVWHCHILTHAESEEGMFGMVTALAVAD